MLVVIGRDWLSAADATGKRGLDTRRPGSHRDRDRAGRGVPVIPLGPRCSDAWRGRSATSLRGLAFAMACPFGPTRISAATLIDWKASCWVRQRAAEAAVSVQQRGHPRRMRTLLGAGTEPKRAVTGRRPTVSFSHSLTTHSNRKPAAVTCTASILIQASSAAKCSGGGPNPSPSRKPG